MHERDRGYEQRLEIKGTEQKVPITNEKETSFRKRLAFHKTRKDESIVFYSSSLNSSKNYGVDYIPSTNNKYHFI